MELRWWRALRVVQGLASLGSWMLLLLLLLLPPPQTAALSSAESQGESPPTAAEEVSSVEVFGREEHSYNSSRVQDDSPLQLDDADDFLPPITITEAPLENPSPPGCSHPLGLTTGDVLDWQISASSSYPSTWDAGCQVKYARLHQPNGRAWCAGRKAAGEWVLVDLGVPAKVTGLMTQGKGDDEEWVTSFELSYSLDAYHWHYARDIYNNKKVFQANVDSHQTRHNYVEPPVLGRFVRLHVLEWHTHPSMRFELLGCQECKTVISEGMDVQLTASSHKPWRRSKSCQPREDAAPNSHRAWCARRKDVTSVGLGTATLDDRCGDARPRGHGPQTLGEGLHIHPLQRLQGLVHLQRRQPPRY